MFLKHIGIWAASVVVIIAAGCSSPQIKTQRVARYQPQISSLPPLTSQNGAGLAVGAHAEAHNVKQIAPNVAAVAGGAGQTAGNKPSEAGTSNSGIKPRPAGKHDTLRRLKSGDRVTIALRGIPVETEVNDVIDGWGEVTLPYIGEVKIVGGTVSEAERKIEHLYVNGGIYNHVNVIVVAEDEVYFVQGEVAKQGKYALSGKVTLLQAISEAGGYTPFANRRKIRVRRGDKILKYNGNAISEGKEKDPPVFADDIIEVIRRRVF